MKVFVITANDCNGVASFEHGAGENVSVIGVKTTEAAAKEFCDHENARGGGSSYATRYEYEEFDVTE